MDKWKHPNLVYLDTFVDLGPHCPFCGKWAVANPCKHLVFHSFSEFGILYLSASLIFKMEQEGYQIDPSDGRFIDTSGKTLRDKNELANFVSEMGCNITNSKFDEDEDEFYVDDDNILKLTFEMPDSICFLLSWGSLIGESATYVFAFSHDEYEEFQFEKKLKEEEHSLATERKSFLLKEQIQSGESQTLEFKRTLSLDIKLKKKEKWIEESILKTIVGFLNTDGGKILIGIGDNKKVTGINDEIQKLYNGSEDKFLRHLNNLIDHQIGGGSHAFIKLNFENLDGKKILIILCEKSDVAKFLNERAFYIRASAATKKLTAKEQNDFCRKRFP